jgi:hypothetical protein
VVIGYKHSNCFFQDIHTILLSIDGQVTAI